MPDHTTDRLRVVHCGCGGIANAWMSTPTRRELVEVVGLVDLDPAKAAGLRERHELPAELPVHTDLAAAIDALQPEAVFDCTVPEAHHIVTTTALGKGCHVLGEKPLAATMAQAAEMVAAAEAAGRVYAITQTRRWNPELHRLRAFLQSGAIGTPHSFFADFAIAADFGGFRATMDHVLLLDMAIHSFDQARVLAGEADPSWVLAQEWNPPGSNYERDASAIATFGFDDGSVFSYRGTWTANGRQTSWECDWRIQATAGAVTWRGEDGIRAERRVDPDEPSAEAGGPLIRSLEDVEVPAGDETDFAKGHDGAIRDFVLALREGRAPACPAADNIKSLAMVHAAIASATSGQREAVHW